MNTKDTSAIRWPLVAGYVGVVVVLLACATIPVTSTGVTPTVAATQVTSEAAVRLDQGAIEIRTENGDWLPVGGETTFEITGELQSTDPWMVTGNTFATRDSTHIDEGLEAGDRVHVKGVILEDGTWLAYSIEQVEAEEPVDPVIILIGKVASIDPWVVNGITLNVTSDTLIAEGIEPEMIVRVEILLLEDGTWEVVSIIPLANFIDIPGCATVTATVVSVNGSELQLVGWPVITLDEDVEIENDQKDEVTLNGNESVLVVVCSSDDGQIHITHIIILHVEEGEIPSDGDGGGEKVLVCHKPDKKGGHTLSIASAAVPAHLGHGDKLGACP
ncbi:MAG TPA: DUF5666 domain-containing protein [Anaerolineales bacterium]|nr:DUF5666 domain-containing protein [Anaerolineales bacterium]